MASHHAIAIRPRTCATILADIREAQQDYLDAIADGPKADDRATEALTRFEDLQADFGARLMDATGLTVEQIRDAYAAAII